MPAARLLAGASGYSFKEWKGTFYPESLKPDAMLAFYSARLPTVEINNTFYRLPKTELLENWAKTVPPDFRFSIKASRRITHMSRLKAESSADPLAFLYRNLASLGAKRGPVLFQLPPQFKKDLPRLAEFLSLLPPDHGAAALAALPDDGVHGDVRLAHALLHQLGDLIRHRAVRGLSPEIGGVRARETGALPPQRLR